MLVKAMLLNKHLEFLQIILERFLETLVSDLAKACYYCFVRR